MTEAGSAVSAEQVDDSDPDTLRLATTREKVISKRVEESKVEKREGRFVLKEDAKVTVDARAHKMSKSRGNVINPDEIIKAYGADAMRIYEMFMGPLEQTKPWNTSGIVGVQRFLEKVWSVVVGGVSDQAPEDELLRLTHRTIKKVSEDIEGLRFNTAVSALMVLVNEIARAEEPPRFAVESLVLLLAPFAPHLGEELWERLGHEPSVQRAPWPSFDPALIGKTELSIPVQVNGKKRGEILVPPGASEADVLTAAKQNANVASHLTGKTLARAIWVQDRILTLVVK